MANKDMQRCSKPLVIKKMQIESTMRYHFTHTRMAGIKKTDNNKCCEACGKTGALIYCWCNVKWCSHFGKQFSTSTSRYLHKTNEIIFLHPQKYLYTNIYNNTIHNTPKVETTWILFIDEWINKMLHIHAMEYYLALNYGYMLNYRWTSKTL